MTKDTKLGSRIVGFGSKTTMHQPVSDLSARIEGFGPNEMPTQSRAHGKDAMEAEADAFVSGIMHAMERYAAGDTPAASAGMVAAFESVGDKKHLQERRTCLWAGFTPLQAAHMFHDSAAVRAIHATVPSLPAEALFAAQCNFEEGLVLEAKKTDPDQATANAILALGNPVLTGAFWGATAQRGKPLTLSPFDAGIGMALAAFRGGHTHQDKNRDRDLMS